MRYLIDGYNFALLTGLSPGLNGPGAVRNARQRVVAWLAARLEPHELQATTVVFDSRRRPAVATPPASPPRVLFAAEQATADELIELLIRQHSAPRQLTVVSSDRRIQRAAHRRGATACECMDWYDQLQRRSCEEPGRGVAGAPREAADRAPPAAAPHLDDKPDSASPLEIDPAEFSLPDESPEDEVFPADYLQRLEDELRDE